MWQFLLYIDLDLAYNNFSNLSKGGNSVVAHLNIY